MDHFLKRSLVFGLAAGALLVLSGVNMAAGAAKSLQWAGCGISKKAFMAELAAAYERKTGIKIELKGGSATLGIRSVSAREVDLGGSCRHWLEKRDNFTPHPEERRVRMDPVAWDALVVLVNKDNPVDWAVAGVSIAMFLWAAALL